MLRPDRAAWGFARRLIAAYRQQGRTTIGPGCSIHRTVRLDVSRGGTITIGSETTIEQGCILDTYGGHIEIGRGVYLGPYCVVYGHGGVRVGDRTLIATHSVLIPANHGFGGTTLIADQPLTTEGIEIGAGCWLGCGVKVMDGVRIGQGSVVGAGSVVTRGLPELCVAVGVPARPIRRRSELQGISEVVR